MSDSLEQRELLEAVQKLAIEESPLWEVFAHVTSLMPDAQVSEQIAAAAWSVGKLLERGQAQLVWAQWTDNAATWSVVSAGEQGDLLKNIRSWQTTSRYVEHLEIHSVVGEDDRHRI